MNIRAPSAAVFVALALSSSACAGVRDLADLRAAKVREEIELGRLDRKVEDKKREAEEAKSRANYASCLADVSRIEAEVSQRTALCFSAKSAAAECNASNGEHRANSSVGGCVAGMLLAGVTAGAALPLTATGCGAGFLLGGATTRECPASNCVDDPGVVSAMVLQEHGLPALPACRGYAGMMVTASMTPQGVGVFVTAVDPFGPAAHAGLQPGDRIDAVKETAVTSPQALDAALEAPPLETVPIHFARPGFLGVTVMRLDVRQNRTGL